MALKLLNGREPKAYSAMGNGHYYGADFLELAEATGIRREVALTQIERMLRQLQKLTREDVSIMDEMVDLYLKKIKERTRYMEVMDVSDL